MKRETLYFEVSEFGTLVFAPAHCVDEVRGIRALVPTSRTWGDARSALSPERYQEPVDLLSAPAEPPESVWPLAVDELTHPEPWPSLGYEFIADWLPVTVVSSYAQAFDSMMSSGVLCRPSSRATSSARSTSPA